MADYMKLISENHTGVPVSCNGDTSVYTNLIWHDTTIDQATLDSEWLDSCKHARHIEIDNRTKELISEGFVYDSQTFSLSLNAQANWLSFKSAETLFTWPVEITTKDDTEYSLVQANLDDFIQASIDTKNTNLDSGRALKISINSKTDIAGIDTVIDNR